MESEEATPGNVRKFWLSLEKKRIPSHGIEERSRQKVVVNISVQERKAFFEEKERMVKERRNALLYQGIKNPEPHSSILQSIKNTVSDELLEKINLKTLEVSTNGHNIENTMKVVNEKISQIVTSNNIQNNKHINLEEQIEIKSTEVTDSEMNKVLSKYNSEELYQSIAPKQTKFQEEQEISNSTTQTKNLESSSSRNNTEIFDNYSSTIIYNDAFNELETSDEEKYITNIETVKEERMKVEIKNNEEAKGEVKTYPNLEEITKEENKRAYLQSDHNATKKDKSNLSNFEEKVIVTDEDFILRPTQHDRTSLKLSKTYKTLPPLRVTNSLRAMPNFKSPQDDETETAIRNQEQQSQQEGKANDINSSNLNQTDEDGIMRRKWFIKHKQNQANVLLKGKRSFIASNSTRHIKINSNPIDSVALKKALDEFADRDQRNRERDRKEEKKKWKKRDKEEQKKRQSLPTKVDGIIPSL